MPPASYSSKLILEEMSLVSPAGLPAQTEPDMNTMSPGPVQSGWVASQSSGQDHSPGGRR